MVWCAVHLVLTCVYLPDNALQGAGLGLPILGPSNLLEHWAQSMVVKGRDEQISWLWHHLSFVTGFRT
jgi:hypothetical protein